MTPERWQQVKEVFGHASELDESARRRYLTQACVDDPALRAQVEALLAAHASADAILDHPMDHFLPPGEPEPSEDPCLGARVGAYQLVACIGRGGMGAVYRARRVDAQYETEVAIKLVRAGFANELVLQRLRAERQILAGLDHPNIARLLDGGATASGEPFLVLELVNGEPIDEYCNSRSLAIEERLRLFQQVCAAVSYAHRHLVVHRDLKPANILVTAEGAIKLLDFGIAKLLQPPSEQPPSAQPTQTLLKAMTPAFSSPEQLLGLRVTTASDVYSLGVVLFHLIAGRSPYRGTLDSPADAIRDVCETEPLRPSIAAVQGAKPGGKPLRGDHDLDDITLRALRKEPEKRYSSVDQFSDDLSRYLAGLPVIARGDRLSYRAGRFWRRHRLAVTAAGLVAIALVGGLLVTLRQARIAREQRALAAQHFASVRQLAHAFIFQVHDSIKDLPGATPARDLLVSTALSYLDTLAKQAGSDRGLQRELAESYDRLGDIQGQPGRQNSGNSTAAIASYSTALRLFEAVATSGPADAGVLSEMAMTHLKRSRVFMMVNGDPGGAAQESLKGVELSAKVAAMKPDDVAAKRQLADAYKMHSIQEFYAGNFTAAAEAADKAVSILETLRLLRPEDRGLERAISAAYSARLNIIPPVVPSPSVIEQKLKLAREVLTLDQHLLDTSSSPDLLGWRYVGASWNTLGLWNSLKGDYAAAAAAFREAVVAMEKTAADTHNAQAQLDLARVSVSLGRAETGGGSLEEAHRQLVRTLSLADAVVQHSNTYETQFVLAESEEELGRIEEQHALMTNDPVQQLREWRAARNWFQRSVPRFEPIIRVAKFGAYDQEVIDRASAGLARSSEEVRRLEKAGTSARR